MFEPDDDYNPASVIDLDDIPEDQTVDSQILTSYTSSIDDLADDEGLDAISAEDLSIVDLDEIDPPELTPDDTDFDGEDETDDFEYDTDED